jgi:hypothetical protein
MPAPATPAQIAIARGRSSGGKITAMIDSAGGISSAAPSPITARAPISADGDPASVANTEPSPNSASPARNTSRRP